MRNGERCRLPFDTLFPFRVLGSRKSSSRGQFLDPFFPTMWELEETVFRMFFLRADYKKGPAVPDAGVG